MEDYNFSLIVSSVRQLKNGTVLSSNKNIIIEFEGVRRIAQCNA